MQGPCLELSFHSCSCDKYNIERQNQKYREAKPPSFCISLMLTHSTQNAICSGVMLDMNCRCHSS